MKDKLIQDSTAMTLPVVGYVAHDVPSLIMKGRTALSLEHLQSQGSPQSSLCLLMEKMKTFYNFQSKLNCDIALIYLSLCGKPTK